MILYKQTYEREGNDAWLIDTIEIHSEDGKLSLIHNYNWNGWDGEISGGNILPLHINNIQKSQNKIDKFLLEHCLYYKWGCGKEEGFNNINLFEIIKN